LPDTLCAKRRLIDSLTAATPGKLSIDDNRRQASNAESLGSTSYCCVLHVEHRYVTGRASDTVDKFYCFLTRRAASAKNFDFSFRTHELLLLVLIVLSIDHSLF
jgi:hypothetical protein